MNKYSDLNTATAMIRLLIRVDISMPVWAAGCFDAKGGQSINPSFCVKEHVLSLA